ncbi:unnamed protein product [Triticum turgidum subsp. durum]|uniref:Uncharacterized protein n=1 Tax=Triticum turgidum subsp. durum TaxID=4567 RepID=A0A9R0WRA5_TRITD|nr:unnamed protein product [Triticum turgidum subsp. durum]
MSRALKGEYASSDHDVEAMVRGCCALAPQLWQAHIPKMMAETFASYDGSTDPLETQRKSLYNVDQSPPIGVKSTKERAIEALLCVIQIIVYPDSQKKMCDGGNVVEPIFDVNTMPVTCSISSIHKQDNQNRAINLNNAESLMDVDHANNIELNSDTVDLVSHASPSAQKRNVDMANWTDGANGSVDKKIKLDNVSSTVESSLSGKVRDGRLSSKVHPLAALPVHDCTDNKTMAGISKSNGKCTFPLDLNVVDDADIDMVDDAATGNSITGLSEDLPEQNTQDLKPAPGDNISSRKPMVEEKLNKGDTQPTDMSGALSLSLAFPASKDQ